MKTILLILALTIASLHAAEPKAPLEPGDHSLTLKVGDLERHYLVHAPPSYDGSKPMPVVIMFHGGGGTARAAMKDTGLADKADQAGFLAVFPEGSPPDPSKPGNFKTNPQTWNDGSGRFDAGKKNVDDVAFTRALLDDLSARLNVNPQRFYVTGFSNGSSLAYRLGIELADRIAAIAPVASSGLKIDDATLRRPVPMITIQGTADPRNPLQGGEVNIFGQIQKRPPPRDSVDRWARMLGCPPEPKVLRNAGGVKVLAYGPGKEGSEVVFYVIEGMGHTWPGSRFQMLPESLVGKTTDKLRANDVIWEFFEKHPMPQAPAPK